MSTLHTLRLHALACAVASCLCAPVALAQQAYDIFTSRHQTRVVLSPWPIDLDKAVPIPPDMPLDFDLDPDSPVDIPLQVLVPAD